MSNPDIVFERICAYPCSTVADVAKALGMDNGTAKDAVQRLRKQGRIKSTQSIKGMPAQYV